MPTVFVSHAFADRILVDEFEETILRGGCGLTADEIFYSSGADTGIPDGSDLMAHVREQVDETGLVVAVLTPTFQTRPVCVAEMGAAWARSGRLFPLLVPGMERSELEGVLSTQLVDYLDAEAALDRLHDRIVEITGRVVDAATWSRFKRKWLRRLPELLESGAVPASVIVSADEHNDLLAKCESLTEALDAAEDDIARLRAERDALAALKDPAEVAEVLLPNGEVERFDALVELARQRLASTGNRWVAEAIVATVSESGGLTLPNDSWARDGIIEAAESGYLDESDGTYWASDAFPAHDEALSAVRTAIAAVGDSDEFDAWFRKAFEAHPTMTNPLVLKRVFLS